MPVLAAMSEREARRIAKAAGGAVHDLRYHGQGANRAGADARHEQQICEVFWPAIRRDGERAMQPRSMTSFGRMS